ncbi:MAG: GNAT family N-acetyltransferase [Chloroflexota bacterium]|nr:GNAT family N-acetyltransferase [Chloroflexota bacterium]
MTEAEGPPEICTERLLLRRFRADDVDGVFAFSRDAEWGRYLEVPMPYSRRDAEEFVAGAVLLDAGAKLRWAIVHEGHVSGFVNLMPATVGVAELGYGIARPLWGQGLVTEAVTAVLRYGFDSLGLARIYAYAVVDNEASWRVMEKLGMRREGFLRRHRMIRGEFVDDVLYSIVRDDWSPPDEGTTAAPAAEGPPQLRTDRLLLRPYRMADVDAVFEYGKDPEWGRYLDVPQPYTLRSAEADVARAVLADPDTAPIWAIVHEDGVVGGISLTVQGPGAAEMGYSLTRSLWGKGLMTEAATAILAFGFGKAGLARIQASTDVRNAASWRVMEKIGMTRTGIARQNRLHRGTRVDDVFYEALRDEWSPPA